MWKAICADAEGRIRELKELSEIGPAVASGKETLWLDLHEPDRKEIALLSDVFRIDPLAIADCVEEVHHPKIDDYGKYLYMAVHGVRAGSARGEFRTIELDILLAPRFLITHRLHDMRSVAHAWERCLRKEGLLASGPDAALQCILSTQADHYVDEVEALQKETLEMESRIFGNRKERFGERLFDIKADIARLRGILSSQRETLHRLSRGEYGTVRNELLMHYRDVYDDVHRAMEMLDTLRDISMALLDTHLNIIANRTNESMKALTLLATFILPLTLVTGWFGMNFPDLTGSKWSHGEIFALALSAAITIGMGLFLKKKGWL